MTAQSSLQSNWNASPVPKVRGTKVPRPVICSISCRCAVHALAKAATRLYDPSKPSATRSACICFSVRRCLRDLLASLLSQPDSFSAYGSSLLGQMRLAYRGSTAPARRYLLMVLRDRPVRRAISRMDNCSRSTHRLMTLSVATSITPTAPCHSKQQVRVLAWVSSRWKSPRSVDHFWVEINIFGIAHFEQWVAQGPQEGCAHLFRVG